MTAAALTDGQARSLARAITGNRLAVAAVYNGIAARVARGLPDFKTVVLGLNDPVEVFAQALLSAAGTDPPWHRAFLAELTAQGMINPELVLSDQAGIDGPVSILPQNADGTEVALADFAAAISPALRTADLLNAFNLAARRLCLIRVAPENGVGKSQGTGFLIGPHTVLTNWHVVSDLIDPGTGTARTGSASRLSCQFETLTDITGRAYPVPEDWLIGFSPLKPDPGHPALPGKALDYCAIRLLGAPGRERGWYDLSQTGALDAETDTFFLFQHPHGVPHRAGFATNTKVDTDPDFLRHRVWTALGSSGGLCLDNRMRPIALHQGGAVKQNGARPYKIAIKLASIHALAPNLGAPSSNYDLISRLSDGSAAVIGRKSTQETLRRMAAGLDSKILVIRGSKLSGKSFSTLILRDSFPTDERTIIQLSAGELPPGAAELARLILRRAGLPETDIDAALKPAAALTTTSATVADIFGILKRLLLGIARANPAQPRTLWLVIDELDTAQLPQIGARTLLDQIYNDAELLTVMRVILIGLTSTLIGVDPGNVRPEVIGDPAQLVPQDIEDCLSSLLVGAGKVAAVGETRRQAQLILGAAAALYEERKQSTPLALLSGYLSRVYMKALEEW